MKRILMLMISGGGGHGAVARSLTTALREAHGDEAWVSVVDLSAEALPGPLARLDDFYRWMSATRSPLWRALWALGGQGWVRSLLLPSLTMALRGRLRRLFIAEDPDLVVSLHSLTNHVPLRVMQDMGLDVPFCTVISDMFTVHPLWCCPDATWVTVPTEIAREQAIAHGLPTERVEVVGQPINPAFGRVTEDRGALRRRLGLDPGLPCVLIVGGGDGIGPILPTVSALDRARIGAQLVVIAGRNASLAEALRNGPWSLNVYVHEFVENMPELMAASDLVITKAGPGTLAEAFASGLPVIVFDYIPGQEQANAHFVRDEGAGAFTREPREVADTVNRWLADDGRELRRYAARAKALAHPEASAAVARRLWALMGDAVARSA